ncbi:HMA domain-containing protein [Cephalotus follicularis]|uniref:HMA domain-containing protein n=1 Tax=Cephalotus follicularis TaxID=3775 RepID=A0A1Q3B3U5_CEPFO|nr:HMA domain-containing protein [Cephalotus follicularis]
MKGIDIFCVSQASTAICLSMDQPSTSSSSSIQLGGRAIDRHNPIIRDERRSTRYLPTNIPCTSQTPPINPKPYHQLHKSNQKSSSSKDPPNDQNKSSKSSKRERKTSSSLKPSDGSKKSCAKPSDIIRKSFARPPGDLFTPPGSSRYLLSDSSTAFFDGLSDNDPVFSLVQFDPMKSQAVNQEQSIALKESKHSTSSRDSNAAKPSSSSSSSLSETPSSDQVVDLRVSMHCRGCEGKLRKHLSRMEGVTSFKIDFAAKKVTIMGDVTPSGVLASVSKVKSAQFWPAISSSDPSTAASINQEIKI